MNCQINNRLKCWGKHIQNSTVILCENEECEVKWYHMKECLGIEKEPEGKFFCKSCLDSNPNLKSLIGKKDDK